MTFAVKSLKAEARTVYGQVVSASNKLSLEISTTISSSWSTRLQRTTLKGVTSPLDIPYLKVVDKDVEADVARGVSAGVGVSAAVGICVGVNGAAGVLVGIEVRVGVFNEERVVVGDCGEADGSSVLLPHEVSSATNKSPAKGSAARFTCTSNTGL